MQPNVICQTDQLKEASKSALSAISKVEVVKCSNGQSYEFDTYRGRIKRAARFYILQAQANATQIGLVRLTILAMFVQGFWYGGHLVHTGRASPGDVLTAFWASLMATQTVEQILPQILVLEKGKTAAKTLQSLICSTKDDICDLKSIGNLTPNFCEGDIEMSNVKPKILQPLRSTCANSSRSFSPILPGPISLL